MSKVIGSPFSHPNLKPLDFRDVELHRRVTTMGVTNYTGMLSAREKILEPNDYIKITEEDGTEIWMRVAEVSAIYNAAVGRGEDAYTYKLVPYNRILKEGSREKLPEDKIDLTQELDFGRRD